MTEQQEIKDESSPEETTTAVGDDVSRESEDEASIELQRRGDIEKCPVCGSHVDPEAYHCRSCRNYFCFQCRARLLPPDKQLQCVNQACDYYGKLVCDVCDRAHEREAAPTVYAEPEDGYWPGWLLLCLIAFGLALYLQSLELAIWESIGLFIVGGVLLQFVGMNIFGKKRMVEHQRSSIHHSCLSCGQDAKVIRTVK